MRELLTITANNFSDFTEIVLVETEPIYKLGSAGLQKEIETTTHRVFVKKENINNMIEALEKIRDDKC